MHFAEVPRGIQATSLTDGVRLVPHVLKPECEHAVQALTVSNRPLILPWVGFGTYKLAKKAKEATYDAIQAGYRHIDTAFCYSNEKTEGMVGEAIQQALMDGTLESRDQVFVTTKHWRSYHGYDRALECLELSLDRLKLDHVDLWLMHWPGPAWKGKRRQESDSGTVVSDDVWCMASDASSSEDMVHLRSETWRAMEDAYFQGKTRAIGVSNFAIHHLQTLQNTCRIVPMVNQVEIHPLHPQQELRQYCASQGIVVEAYASLGGQDTSPEAWDGLLGTPSGSNTGSKTNIASKGKENKKNHIKSSTVSNLLHAPPVIELAALLDKTPAQVLLKWALQQDCIVIPKTSNPQRMAENAQLFDFQLTVKQVEALSQSLLETVRQNNPFIVPSKEHDNPQEPDEDEQNAMLQQLTRLCWRRDRFRYLDFD